MAKNTELEGVMLWTQLTESGIQNNPSPNADKDRISVNLATTESRVVALIDTIKREVIPEWYAELPKLRNITNGDLKKAEKELEEILKDPSPERIHKSLLGIKHIPTMAEERPLTQKGTIPAHVRVNEEWDDLPYLVYASAPAYDRTPQGQIIPDTFRSPFTAIYVDDTVVSDFASQLLPNVRENSWMYMDKVFHDPDAWIEENSWGWRVIQLTGFKISKGMAGLKIGFYPNKLHFHSKAKDYPAADNAGPDSVDRNDDDL